MIPIAVSARAGGLAAQRGQIILLFIALVSSVALMVFVYGASDEVGRSLQADTRTAAALAQARDVLIARAVTDSNRPGSLPCPDTDDDGVAELLAGTICPSYIGRLPWRTLGIGDVRDDHGERLWYALSPNFRDATGVAINSDTLGNRTVYGGTTSSVITQTAAAIIFAPGVTVPGQMRDSVSATCATTGTSIARRLCASNYLETDPSGTPAWSNASTTGPYMNAPSTLAFNDKILIVRNTDFMHLVERRVARDMLETLRTYRTNSNTASLFAGGCDCFPFPDSNNDGISNTDSNRGRIPVVALPHAWGFATWIPIVNPLTGLVFPAIPNLPSYFTANNWQNIIYYSVSKTSLQNAGSGCTTCSANLTLSLDGGSGYGVVLIMPGPMQPGQTRTAWAHYLDEAENRDANPQAAGGGAVADPAANDAYVTPPKACPTGQCPTAVSGVQRCVTSSSTCPLNVTRTTNDQIFTITAPPPNSQCGANAYTLRSNAPCHTTGGNVKASCQSAATNLQGCGCSSAANTMITPPCRNTLSPPACQSAVQSLQTCTS